MATGRLGATSGLASPPAGTLCDTGGTGGTGTPVMASNIRMTADVGRLGAAGSCMELRAKKLVRIASRLRVETAGLAFAPPVTHVYRPLEYAWAAHRQFLERYAGRGAVAVLIGMNPGPFGMVQTGVPFGDSALVREWLGIEAKVGRPPDEHPKRPVLGLECPRTEVSGRRLWGWARAAFGEPDRFFARFFVWNYCPLAFVETSGRNRTPDKLPAAERRPLFKACDRALLKVVEEIRPTHVVGIGRFAFDRASAALGTTEVTLGWGPHPSPASPAANRGWAPQFESALLELGIGLPSRNQPGNFC